MTYAQAMELVTEEQDAQDAEDEAYTAELKEKWLRLTILFALMCTLYLSAVIQERLYPLPTHTPAHHAAKKTSPRPARHTTRKGH